MLRERFKKPTTPDEAVTLLASLCLLLFPALLLIGSACADIALSSVALLFLLHSSLTRDWKWLREPWFVCLALLWAYMLARGMFAQQPKEALHRGLPFLRYFVFAAAIAHWLMQGRAMRRYFLISLTACVSFIMADGLLQWITGRDLFGRTLLIDPLGHIRLTGPFGQTKPIMGIMLAWLSFPVCFSLAMAPDGKFKTGRSLALGLAFSLSALCMVALSGERMALLLTLLGWCVTLLLIRGSKRLLLGGIFAGLLALGIMAVAIPSMFDRQIAATVTLFSHWHDSAYGKIMASDLQLAARNPVFGLGANHFRIACPTLYPGAAPETLLGVCNIHPHNIYFEWLIEEGLIGLLLFLSFIALTLRHCRHHWPARGASPLLLGWSVACVLRIWPIGSTTGFFSNWGAPPFWLALGMLLAYSHAPTERNAHDHAAIPV